MSDSTHGAKSATDDDAQHTTPDDHWTGEFPNAESGPESEALETFVETPMDTHTRCDCETRVRGWHDCELAAVSIIVDIDAAEPLEVSLNADDARRLAGELHKAAIHADELAFNWGSEVTDE